MLILPHSAELGFDKKPYVTYIIIFLCVIIHYYQDQNRYEIHALAASYCNSIYDPSIDENTLDILRTSVSDCEYVIETIHSVPDRELVVEWFKEGINEDKEYSEAEFNEVMKALTAHYTSFSLDAPRSLDAKLEYDPSTLNPIRAITAVLSHADWWHLMGNLIFFLAFAPAVELLLQSAIKYVAIIISISLVTAVTYSISTFINGTPIPTLGLSGVVMGMIGLSAYLMPNAKIRTFVWFIVFVRNFYIPAWMLAVGYIGLDTYELLANSDHGGINVIAHVSGGIAGYLIGLFWLNECKEDIRDELDEEIEYRRAQRTDKLGVLSSSRGGQNRIANERREYYAKQEYSKFEDRLYKLVKVGNDSDAVVLMLNDYDLYKDSIEIYEALFWEMRDYLHRRSMLCLGRLNIGELLKQGKYARAIKIAEACFEAQESFVLADPGDVMLLVDHAQKQGRYDLACSLLKKEQVFDSTLVNSEA